MSQEVQVVEATPNIYDAMLQVMEAVSNIDKNLQVGEGRASYKGVSDKDVKHQIQRAMIKAKLVCFPTEIKAEKQIDRWEEPDYNGVLKRKQSVFTTVDTKYKIVHAPTGESIEIVGYGHGVDSQDKSAGKATTYALKNALLYTFLVPTGAIDDTDKQHSDSLPQAPRDLEAEIRKCTTLAELQVFWAGLTKTEKDKVQTLKDELKSTLK